MSIDRNDYYIVPSSDKEGTVSSCTTLYSEDISSPVQSLNNNNLESFRPHIIQTEIDNIDPILNVLPQITSDDKYPLWQGFIGNNHIVDEEEKLDSFPLNLKDDYNDEKGLHFSEASVVPLLLQEAHGIQTEIDNIDPILNVLPQITSDDKYPLWQGFIGNNHIVDEEEKLDSFPLTLEDDYNDDKGLDFSETSWELMPPLFVQEATRK